MLWYQNLRMVPKIVLPVGLLLVITLSLLTWQIQQRSSQALRAAAEREFAEMAGNYGNGIRTYLEGAIATSQTLADALEESLLQGKGMSRDTLAALHSGMQKGNEMFIGTGSVWLPDAFDGKDAEFKNTPGSNANGLFAPYSASGSAEVTTLSNFENELYYREPLKNKKSFVSDPYPYVLNNQQFVITTVASPVVVDNKTRGVVFTDILLENVHKLLQNIDVFESGECGLLTQDGIIISHPNKELQGKNLFELARGYDIQSLKSSIQSGKAFFEQRQSENGAELCYYMPIPMGKSGYNWYFVISAPLDEVLAEAQDISRVTIYMSAAATLLVLLLVYVVVNSCSRPMVYLAGVAREIAGGNLNIAINDQGLGGEVGQLASSMKTMVESLVVNIEKAHAMSADAQLQAEKAQQAMREAKVASQDAEAKRDSILRAATKLEELGGAVSVALEELNAQISHCESGATEQAARVTETATAMNEMNATVLEVARSASHASDVSVTTRSKADGGAAVVRQAVSGIRTVQDQSLALKEDMAALGQHANSISQIMGVISDIADQTNLLALNAAIEAARAGEAGRGFAVVADEVRKLAEKTMASTTDVGNAIRAIQQSAEKSMTQVDATVKTIDEAALMVNQSGVALEEIVSLVDNTADQVRAIATASEEQSATSDEINQSIAQVNTIASDTALSMQESARAVSGLNEQTQSLARLIEELKNA